MTTTPPQPEDGAAFTVIVPIYGEHAMRHARLAEIFLAASTAWIRGEVLLILTFDRNRERTFTIPDTSVPVRQLNVAEPGKWRAVLKGAANASADILVMVDADACPSRNAFRAILRPLLNNQSDVSLGRIRIAGPSARRARILHKWARASCLVWHHARSRQQSTHWALPGPLYAIRRSFVPDDLAVRLMDDASIGLSAAQRGARFVYCPGASTYILPPETYLQWLRQKIRVRAGWAKLRAVHPREVMELSKLIRESATTIGRRASLRGLILHDRLIHLIARVLSSFVSDSEWKPVPSTKEWHD